MEKQTLRDTLDEMDYRASCKRFCDDIDQRLDKVKADMADRAIWELFQNAGDVAIDNGDGRKAHIRMTLTPTEFIFAHKGNPFTYDTLNSLVRQVSSQSKEEDEQATGQYGTGFVTTHCFGKVLSITSSMEKPFSSGMYVDVDNFVIDRLYEDKQEFYIMMPKQLAEVKKLALDAPMTPVAREWTELRYDLSTAIGGNGFDKAKRGLEACVKTLPFLMTINPIIADVEIIDELDGSHMKFCARQLKDECGMQVMMITTDNNGAVSTQKIYFITSDNREDVIILPLASPTTARSLDGMAKLFVNYPLIGSENFGFEFIFHSRRFIPEEKRDGLFLPEKDANSPRKHENNVKVLNEMTEMLFNTLKSLEYDFTDWVEILNLKLDAPDGSDSVRTEFFTTFKKKWATFYESLEVFDIDGEMRSLASDKVRLYSDELTASLQEEDGAKHADAIYEAAKTIGNIPYSEFILKWSNVVAGWNPEHSDCFISIDALAQSLSTVDCDTDVLLGFDLYLKDQGLTSLFDKYELIPNIDGELMYQRKLRNASAIPSWLSRLMVPFVMDSIKQFVDERFIPVCSFEDYNRKDLRKDLNDQLDFLARDTFRRNYNPHPCDGPYLVALAKIALIARTDSEDTIRAKALKVICGYLGIPFEVKVLTPLDEDEKELAPLPFKHLVENLLLEISAMDEDRIKENSDYIFGLHQALSNWAEYYNRNDGKGLATEYGCFPDMLSLPSLAKNLRNGGEIPQEIFDFYEVVMNEDLRATLVAPEYAEFYDFEKVEAIDIAKEIEDALAKDNFEHDVVLDIIKYIDKNEHSSALFPRIAEKKADLFMKQVKDECKEGIFRLMKVDDAEKLNQLAELAEDCDMDEILRFGRDAARQKANQQADFKYKQALGEYVEEFVLNEVKRKLDASLGDDSIRVEVDDIQGGQDIIVFCNHVPAYYLEVKSRWCSSLSVEMSQLQLITCVDHADRYALCCLNMTGTDHEDVKEHVYPDVTETISRIRAITNIGYLAADACHAVEGTDDKVHVGGGYSCIVPQKVVEREGKSFEHLLNCIAEACIRTAIGIKVPNTSTNVA